MIRRTSILLSVGTLICVGLSTASAAAARPTTLLTDDFSRSFAVRPSLIWTSGDGSTGLGKLPAASRYSSARRDGRGWLHWSSWSNAQANGTGTLWTNDCTPSCGAGTYHLIYATLHAFRARHGRFTRFKVVGWPFPQRGPVRTGSGDPMPPCSVTVLRLVPGGPGYVWGGPGFGGCLP
jgi:hypothetical protein